MDSLAQIASLLNPNEIYEIAFKVTAAVGVILSAFGASIAFFLKRYWDGRDRQADKKEREIASKESEHLKQRDILYESLKWFEGGTQKRSIGIAVVNTSWNGYKEFRPLWIEVFLNQAIYLLTTSEEKTKFHEHDNLRRIMDLLVREKTSITEQSKILLTNTLTQKVEGKIPSGLTLTDDLKTKIIGLSDLLDLVAKRAGVCEMGATGFITPSLTFCAIRYGTIRFGRIGISHQVFVLRRMDKKSKIHEF